MSSTIEIEIDDAHEFMVKNLMESDAVDADSVEEFVSGLVDQSIYSTYQQLSDQGAL